MMFMNLVRVMAASWADRLVASPRSTIVLVNPTMFSLDTPSWPAASATAAISPWEADTCPVMARSPDSILARSAGVPSTVLRTPAKADSQSTAAFIEPASAPVVTRPNLVRAEPAFSHSPLCSCADCARRPILVVATVPVLSAAFTTASRLEEAFFIWAVKSATFALRVTLILRSAKGGLLLFCYF